MLNTKIKPMLLEKAVSPFNNENYIFELKVDGVRALLHFDADQTRIFSRHGTECTTNMPELKEATKFINAQSVILDGELVVFGDDGRPCFSSVMKRFLGDPKRRPLLKQYPVKFFVFDILSVDGKPVIDKPLMDRKEILQCVIESNDTILTMDYIEEFGEGFFEKVKELQLEGIVAKRKDSNYQMDKRSKNWLKIKNYQSANCVVLGYKLDKAALHLGQETNGEVRYSGVCELGLNRESFYVLREASEDIMMKKDKNNIWLEPLIKCKIKHIGRDSNKRFREATFQQFII